MFGIGFLEICVICVVGLVLIGPQNFPKVMVELGKFFVQMRRMTNEVKSSVTEAVREANVEIEKEKFNPKGIHQSVKEKVESFVESEVFQEEKPVSQKGDKKEKAPKD